MVLEEIARSEHNALGCHCFVVIPCGILSNNAYHAVVVLKQLYNRSFAIHGELVTRRLGRSAHIGLEEGQGARCQASTAREAGIVLVCRHHCPFYS